MKYVSKQDILDWANKQIEEARQAEYYGKMLYDIYEGLIWELENERFEEIDQ